MNDIKREFNWISLKEKIIYLVVFIIRLVCQSLVSKEKKKKSEVSSLKNVQSNNNKV